VVATSAGAVVEGWVVELSDGLSVSASAVQDRLFDLWGLLDEGESRREVEHWLTETLDRQLYTSNEVVARLQGLAPLQTTGS
jgi:hypothetical protein